MVSIYEKRSIAAWMCDTPFLIFIYILILGRIDEVLVLDYIEHLF